jgi:hypothetical protein
MGFIHSYSLAGTLKFSTRLGAPFGRPIFLVREVLTPPLFSCFIFNVLYFRSYHKSTPILFFRLAYTFCRYQF